MTVQTFVSGALAALGIIVCGVLAALARPVPDVLVLGTTAAIAGYFGAVHPGHGTGEAPPDPPGQGRQDPPNGRHAESP